MYDASELELLFKEFSFIQFKYKKGSQMTLGEHFNWKFTSILKTFMMMR